MNDFLLRDPGFTKSYHVCRILPAVRRFESATFTSKSHDLNRTGWCNDFPSGKNCPPDEAPLGIVAGLSLPRCKGEHPSTANVSVITLVQAPGNEVTRSPTAM